MTLSTTTIVEDDEMEEGRCSSICARLTCQNRTHRNLHGHTREYSPNPRLMLRSHHLEFITFPSESFVGAGTVLCEFGALGLCSSCAMAESSGLEAPLVKRRVAEADLIWFKVAAISGT